MVERSLVSWPALARAALAAGGELTEGLRPGSQQLRLAATVVAVELADNLEWYRLAAHLPIPGPDLLEHGRALLRTDFALSRPALRKGDLALLADLPAADAAALAAALRVFARDHRCATTQQNSDHPDQGAQSCPSSALTAGTFRCLSEFVDRLTVHWSAARAEDWRWRLTRRPTASPTLPQMLIVALNESAAAIEIPETGRASPPTGSVTLNARILYLLRFNASSIASAALLPNGMAWRAAVPIAGLRISYLETAYRSLKEAYRTRPELQALDDERVAQLYLQFQAIPQGETS